MCIKAPFRFRVRFRYVQVYEGTWRGRRVAVKAVQCDSEAQRQAMTAEAQLCARFRWARLGIGNGNACIVQQIHQLLELRLW